VSESVRLARVVPLDRTSFDVPAFIEREAPGLLNYFARRALSLDDAADLLGDTLLVVWRRERSIPSDATDARMWLYGVARRVLSTHRRSAARRTALGERLRGELSMRPNETVQADPVFERVRALVSDLGAVDREIIELVYWEGFSLAEVASILRKRPGTVRSRHARARAALRAALLATDDIEA
jgi:RNA polymerase sigma-70 factor, ECF subfamily